ncbi:hypothetical protein QAD02_021237 [Eretmocerus hayati]|uniref:Uncharacterized protein n=1 Tax=Eretmocerus hayati TaxID=131215 RepID=A0ACC2PS68_9HYME|nr:hypothetical protein QAD02_021237 [Eretmocerus hayati]
MQVMKTCTGYRGCNWCLHRGVYVKSGDSGAVKYTVIHDVRNRTDAETKEHMREVANSNVKDVCGLKFPSWLLHLLTFSIIWGFGPDPMHHVDLGLGKQFLERWLTMLTPLERDRIDSLMRKIEVPNNIQRLSWSIKDRKF